MRMLLKAQLDIDKGNQAIEDGTLPKLMQSVMEQLKPEAAYFGPVDGRRTAWFVFDLQKTSDIPRLYEPLFHELGATCETTPVMNAEDLNTGLSQLK